MKGVVGTAYFESHKVRTMNETFMVVVDTDSTVRFVEMQRSTSKALRLNASGQNNDGSFVYSTGDTLRNAALDSFA